MLRFAKIFAIASIVLSMSTFFLGPAEAGSNNVITNINTTAANLK